MTAPKLVRDLVPVVNTRIATVDEMPGLLRAKLQEEVAEYLKSGDPVELADILEVLYALADAHRIGPAGLDGLREAKAAGMGRFAHRLVWLGNEDGAP